MCRNIGTLHVLMSHPYCIILVHYTGLRSLTAEKSLHHREPTCPWACNNVGRSFSFLFFSVLFLDRLFYIALAVFVVSFPSDFLPIPSMANSDRNCVPNWSFVQLFPCLLFPIQGSGMLPPFPLNCIHFQCQFIAIQQPSPSLFQGPLAHSLVP